MSIRTALLAAAGLGLHSGFTHASAYIDWVQPNGFTQTIFKPDGYATKGFNGLNGSYVILVADQAHGSLSLQANYARVQTEFDESFWFMGDAGQTAILTYSFSGSIAGVPLSNPNIGAPSLIEGLAEIAATDAAGAVTVYGKVAQAAALANYGLPYCGFYAAQNCNSGDSLNFQGSFSFPITSQKYVFEGLARGETWRYSDSISLQATFNLIVPEGVSIKSAGAPLFLNIATVPEPTESALLVGGLIILAVIKAKRLK